MMHAQSYYNSYEILEQGRKSYRKTKQLYWFVQTVLKFSVARALISATGQPGPLVSRYVYCSYSCVCRGTVCILHVHMNLTIIRTFLNYDTNFKNNNTCIPLLQTLSGQDDITHTQSMKQSQY